MEAIQESPVSVTVHLNKWLIYGSVRDPLLPTGQAPCFRRVDFPSGKYIVDNHKPPKEYAISSDSDIAAK